VIFVYRALDEQGSLQRGYEECDNARNLKKILEEKGWKLLSVHKYWRRFLKTRKKCRKELQGFFIGLSQLLKQKITLRDALSILSLDKDLQPITQRLSEDIRQGLCFSQALQAQRFFFPNFAILHIKNAEVTSSLEDGCLKVGQFFELQELFSEKKRQALTYPLFV
jgi:type II secretory pathway component PulF